jgi:hypothetical protein
MFPSNAVPWFLPTTANWEPERKGLMHQSAAPRLFDVINPVVMVYRVNAVIAFIPGQVLGGTSSSMRRS